MEEEGQLANDVLSQESEGQDEDSHLTDSRPERRSEAYLTERQRKAVYSREEELRDVQLVKDNSQQTQRAFGRLIKYHIHLATQPAEEYARPEFGLEVDDLVSVGMEFLADAIRRFDPRRGTRFGTFARGFVAKRVRWVALAHQQSGLLPLPAERRSEVRVLRRARSTMYQISGCEPSETDLAEKLGWTIERVRDTQEAMHSVVSYDALEIEKPIDELFELTGGENHSAVVERKEEVAELLSYLDERARRVLLLHYAPLGGTPLTLAQIGLIYGVSKEQIRRIEMKALEEVRATHLMEKLRYTAAASEPIPPPASLHNTAKQDSYYK